MRNFSVAPGEWQLLKTSIWTVIRTQPTPTKDILKCAIDILHNSLWTPKKQAAKAAKPAPAISPANSAWTLQKKAAGKKAARARKKQHLRHRRSTIKRRWGASEFRFSKRELVLQG